MYAKYTPPCWLRYECLLLFTPRALSSYEISVRISIYRTDRPTTDRRPATDDRPMTSHLEISNGHISARDHPIHFMFGSTVGFWGRRFGSAAILENSNGDISAADHPICLPTLTQSPTQDHKTANINVKKQFKNQCMDDMMNSDN